MYFFSKQPRCCLTWIEPQILRKCCLLHMGIILPRCIIFCIFVSIFIRLRLFTSSLCDLFFIIIFIFITVNHIISLKQTHFLFGRFCEKFSIRVMLGFCLIFCQFQPGVAYESMAYTKKVCSNIFFFFFTFITKYFAIDSKSNSEKKKATHFICTAAATYFFTAFLESENLYWSSNLQDNWEN